MNENDDDQVDFTPFTGFRQQKRQKRFADDMGDDDDDDDRGHGGLGLGNKPNISFTTSKKDPAKDRLKQQGTSQPSLRDRSRSPAPGTDFAAFNKHTTGFGQRMLERMGWKSGTGLGSSGEGMVNPVETKLRPKGMGMGFRGFDERTDQAKADAAMSSEDEEDAVDKDTKLDGWKRQDTTTPASSQRPSSSKPKKTTYHTAKDVIAHAEQSIQHQPQKVLDMTGPSIREISLSDIKRTDSPTLMESTTRLPELRHNVRLLVDLAKGDLENMSREKQTNHYKFIALQEELESLQIQQQLQLQKQQTMDQIKEVTMQIQQQFKLAQEQQLYQTNSITALYGPLFETLSTALADQVALLQLDTIVVAVWVPKMKLVCADWDVLGDPECGLDDIRRWRSLLRCHDDEDKRSRSSRKQHLTATLVATPYESMMNTIWLHRVRSAINNEWNVREPESLIQLLTQWQTVLPQYLFENVVHQLVLPKITRAVNDWDPRQDQEMIHTWIHPWLPLLREWRMADLFTSIRHKLSVVLRQWHPSDESALEVLSRWKGVWTQVQMDTFLQKTVVPKLSQVLRQEFVVNPHDQQLEPLFWCLAWHELLNPEVLQSLLETEVFTQWLRILYKWLTLNPENVNFDEVKEWYLWWKQVFASLSLADHPSVLKCTRKALDMMSAASSGDTVPKAYVLDG
ncbi:TFP11-domain-containing protein [Hesseltinella vesiculosa]|uniref:TFP11-domain-containing protein n=1 Tax=Hesseltinella vesiculosa TaxID=101127 RepID=A0A1X2G4E9_9FUNG|nr:TFP11-domain-containing protein [Hesseltinella vesiculosa]